MRGYDAITMTHGIVTRLNVADFTTVLNSARFKFDSFTRVVNARLKMGRMAWIMREFSKCFQRSIETKFYSVGEYKRRVERDIRGDIHTWSVGGIS